MQTILENIRSEWLQRKERIANGEDYCNWFTEGWRMH